jgi:hypothetical protein
MDGGKEKRLQNEEQTRHDVEIVIEIVTDEEVGRKKKDQK